LFQQPGRYWVDRAGLGWWVAEQCLYLLLCHRLKGCQTRNWSSWDVWWIGRRHSRSYVGYFVSDSGVKRRQTVEEYSNVYQLDTSMKFLRSRV